MDLKLNEDPPKTSVKASSVSNLDQHFLLNFIMGNYLGPDIKFDKLRSSSFHRLAQGFPPYVSSDLGASYVSVTLLESLYYSILRNATPSLVLGPSVLHKYIKGILPLSRSVLTKETKQFPDIFPSSVHQQIWYPESFRIVKGIVIIDDPVTSYMREEDLEKFKFLSGMNNLRIDIDEARNYRHQYQNGGETRQDFSEDSEEERDFSNGNGNSSDRFQQKYKRRCISDPPTIPAFPCVVTPSKDSKHCEKDRTSWSTCNPGPVVMPLLSVPTVEVCASDPSVVLSGTIKRGVVGPPIGAVDIGIGKVAYYFQVSLPGIRKDFCQFSCEIEPNGKVHLQGFTSGGNPIKKRSRVYQMRLQQLCPPGPFTLSFSLPGPVDPRLFAPNFRLDGIFEGVILKDE